MADQIKEWLRKKKPASKENFEVSFHPSFHQNKL